MAGHRGDRLVEAGIRLSAVLVIASLALIFVFVGKEALPLLLEPGRYPTATLSRLLLPQPGEHAFSWQPVSVSPQFSLLPLVVGTLKVTLVALLVARPVALAAAVFATEFSPVWLREIIKPVIEMLAGIPSVVLGFFALMVLASWLQALFGFTYRLNAVSAGIAMSLAVIPVVF